jgi:membrane-associated phospholipid phosphatase
MYALAAAVAYSRVYVGAHWPSDLVPSMAIGVLIGLGVVASFCFVLRRKGIAC